MNTKRFSVAVIVIVILSLTVFAVPTIVIDPYFHYHAPLENLEYPIDNQRYQNNGMLKNFSYDAIIIGTSMTLNFNSEEFDELFGVDSLHVSFLGGSYKELDNNLRAGLKTHPDVKCVLRGVDLTFLDKDKDYMKYELSYYPEYLYDENIFNDVSYVLNKEVFDLSWKVLEYTELVRNGSIKSKEENTSVYSKESVLNSFERMEPAEEVVLFTEEDRKRVWENVHQNITSTIQSYPEVTFYLFITPYSICYWDEICREGKLDYMMETERTAIEELLQYENVRLFSFADNTDLICNLDNYCDQGHYSPQINSKMLHWIEAGEYELTQDNYVEHLERLRSFLESYDYDAIYNE